MPTPPPGPEGRESGHSAGRQHRVWEVGSLTWSPGLRGPLLSAIVDSMCPGWTQHLPDVCSSCRPPPLTESHPQPRPSRSLGGSPVPAPVSGSVPNLRTSPHIFSTPTAITKAAPDKSYGFPDRHLIVSTQTDRSL